MKRVLLLLPTSTYRTADFLDAATKLGVEVVVASEETSTMEPLGEGGLLTLDFLDPKGASERVARFHEKYPIRAVIPVDEETVVVAAAIAERLGLPQNDPEAALRARFKHRMREALSEKGVPQPSFATARTGDDAERLAGKLRYPVVLKPVFLSGSRGVVRVDDEESFRKWFAWLGRFLSGSELKRHGGPETDLVLIEEYIDGREVALEALAIEGRLHPLALFDKPDPLVGPHFEETLYVTPSRLPEEVQREITRVAELGSEAIGLRHGPVHAELRVDSEGAPKLIEVAGRSIGGLCSRTLRFGLGMSLEELILRHALGEDVSGLARERGAAGVLMIPIPAAGKLLRVSGLDEAKVVDGVTEVTITAHVGKILEPLPEGSSYLGFVFARGPEPSLVEGALRAAHARLRFEVAAT